MGAAEELAPMIASSLGWSDADVASHVERYHDDAARIFAIDPVDPQTATPPQEPQRAAS